MRIKFLFSFLFVLIVSLVLVGCVSKGPSKYDTFAKCLTEKGATIYGTEWCPHCKNQKKLFGDSFQYIDYVDCDRDKDECLRNGIRGYPTWIINEESYSGRKELRKISFSNWM